MPIGLQTFDADGGIVLDVTTRVGKFLEEFQTGTGNGSRQVAIAPGLGEPFVFSLANMDTHKVVVWPAVSISPSGLVSWFFTDFRDSVGRQVPRMSVRCFVGVY